MMKSICLFGSVSILLTTGALAEDVDTTTLPSRSPYTLSLMASDIAAEIKKNGDAEISFEIPVPLIDGRTLFFWTSFAPADKAEFMTIRAATYNCGKPGKPIVYVQSGGSFEYKWCDHEDNDKVWMDTYVYSGGVAQPRATKPIKCTSNVPAAVYGALCPP